MDYQKIGECLDFLDEEAKNKGERSLPIEIYVYDEKINLRHRDTWKTFEFEKTEKFNLPDMTKLLLDRYDDLDAFIPSIYHDNGGNYGIRLMMSSNDGFCHRFDIIGKDNFIWKMVDYGLFKHCSDDGLKEEFQKQLGAHYALLSEAYKKMGDSLNFERYKNVSDEYLPEGYEKIDEAKNGKSK